MKKVWVQVLLSLLVLILVVAGALTAKFLTIKCVEGTYACVNGAVAHCVENDWQKTVCDYGCLDNPIRCKEAPTDLYVVQPAPIESPVTASEGALEAMTNVTPPEVPSITPEEQPGEITTRQLLQFYRNGMLVYTQNTNLAPLADFYLVVKPELGNFYTYTVEFSPGIPYITVEDLKDWKFNMQGKTYTIGNAHMRSDKKIDAISLLGDPFLELANTTVSVNNNVVPSAFYSVISDGRLLKAIVLWYKPTFESYLSLEGSHSYDDPIMKQFSILFKDYVVPQTETVEFTAQGTRGKMMVRTEEGIPLEIPIFSDGRHIHLGIGKSMYDAVYLEGDSCSLENDNARDQCRRAEFLIVDNGKAKLMQVTDFNFGSQRISIVPVITGTNFGYHGGSYPFIPGKPTPLNISDISGLSKPIVVTIDRKFIRFDVLGSTDKARINLAGNAYLEIMNTMNTTFFEGFVFGEYLSPGDKFPQTKLSDVQITPEIRGAALTYTLNDINLGGEGFGFVPKNDKAPQIQYFVTNKGTMYQYNKNTKDSVLITYPHRASYGAVMLKTGSKEYPFGKNNFYLGSSPGSYPTLTDEQLPVFLARGKVTKE